MKIVPLLVGLALALTGASASAATIISDDFTAPTVNSGFIPGEGVNAGITPPSATRLTGSLASSGLYYVRVGAKDTNAYTIGATNRVNITQGSQSGRFTIAQFPNTNGFDFGPALGTSAATAANPKVYDVTISMANKVNQNNASNTIGRVSFGFGTVEGGTGAWSFGLQLVSVRNQPDYNIHKRIKTASSGVAALDENIAGGLATQIPARNEVNFKLRVTDAGAESGSAYNSRVQVSVDGGATWFYDTKTDPSLVNGFRFDTAARFVSFDQAPNGGADTYDNFSITTVNVVSGGTLTISNNSGTANVSLQGTPGQSYVIESSSNLTSWTGVYTNAADINGTVQFGEVSAANAKFYRARTE